MIVATRADDSMAALPEPTLGARQGRLFQASEKPAARPFLKWAGGKTRPLPAFRRYIPKVCGTYFAPFLKALFMKRPLTGVLGDCQASSRRLGNCAGASGLPVEEASVVAGGASAQPDSRRTSVAWVTDDIPRARIHRQMLAARSAPRVYPT